MSEEDAIETLSHFSPLDCGMRESQAIEIILNLIEELKDTTRAYDAMQGIMPEGHPIIIADKEYFDSGRFIEKYISKDKIREILKNYVEYYDYTVDYMIEDFKKLLGEKYE